MGSKTGYYIKAASIREGIFKVFLLEQMEFCETPLQLDPIGPRSMGISITNKLIFNISMNKNYIASFLFCFVFESSLTYIKCTISEVHNLISVIVKPSSQSR